MFTVAHHHLSLHRPLGAALALAAVAGLLAPTHAEAHCDTLDGPVVTAARTALDTRKVAPALAWVKPAQEWEVRVAFSKALMARRSEPAQRDASDQAFFEAVVRAHRVGEGAPYEGLKPAGRDPGEAIRTADLALERGDASALEALLVEKVRAGIHERFARVRDLPRPANDVAAGRAWVDAYVEYVHYAEGLASSEGASHADAPTARDTHAATATHGAGVAAR